MQGLCYVVDITVVLTTFISTFDFIINLIDVEGRCFSQLLSNWSTSGIAELVLGAAPRLNFGRL